jgi:hypothetical protein
MRAQDRDPTKAHRLSEATEQFRQSEGRLEYVAACGTYLELCAKLAALECDAATLTPLHLLELTDGGELRKLLTGARPHTCLNETLTLWTTMHRARCTLDLMR